MRKLEQTQEAEEMLKDVVNRWAPFPEDTFEIKMMRALLGLAAFEMDCQRVKEGKLPIRNDYPIKIENVNCQ